METPFEIKPLLKKMVKSYLWNALIWPKNVMALKIAMMDQMRKIVWWLVMEWLNFNVSMKTIQFCHWSVFQKSNVAMASMIVPRVKMRMIVQQTVTKTTNLHVVRSVYDQSHIFHIRLKPKFSSFVNFALRNSFSSPNSEVGCIKYNLLDFCNYLLVTANLPFENNRSYFGDFLLQLLCKLKTVNPQNKCHFKTFMVN